MNYPKRGCMSEDGKYYTHFDGSVHERSAEVSLWECSMRDSNQPCLHKGVVIHCRIIAGAYVPSDEEQAACVMARAMMVVCYLSNAHVPCNKCCHMESKTCPARVYLASKKQPDAWEVRP